MNYIHWLRYIGKRIIFSKPILNSYILRVYVKSRINKIVSAVKNGLPPRQINLEGTNKCNSRCIMCPYKNMIRTKRDMPFELFLKGLNDAKQLGTKWIQPQFFGEPLLDILIFDKIKLAKDRGFYVSLFTNGSLLNETNAKRMIESGIDEIKISIDSNIPEVYEKIRVGLVYEKVVSNVLKFMQLKHSLKINKPEVWIMFTEILQNHDEIKSFIKYWSSKVDVVNISIAHNWATNFINVKTIPDSKYRFPCPSLWNQLVVTESGEISPCCTDYEGKLSLGNLNDISLYDAWNGDKLKKLRNLHLNNKRDSIPICKACDEIGIKW